ncbi:MAG: NYN domain-containing protein, partial [Gemmatimonadetes bacterium]|nr:NYN domain-containing protein [Gemmatimonadota bacterium]
MKARHPHAPVNHGPITPMHRGPQAVTQQGIGNIAHAPNAALLIDFDNVTMGIRSDLGHELRNLLGSDIIKGKVAVQRAYADWRRYPQYIVPLAESSIDMIMAPAYGSSKKNATDIRLAIDAIELVFTRPEIGTFILLSGDSDFSSLVMKLKEYGKYVIGVGIRESSSDLLVQNCDEYYSYNALAGLVKSGEGDSVRRWDPWELVTEAVTRMQQNHDVMRSDRLKQVMQEIDASFDEKDVNMSKFSKFCTEAARRGLLKVTKLDNGQYEVAPADGERESSRASARPAARNAEAAPATTGGDSAGAEASAEGAEAPEGEAGSDREGRPRRTRRGGRGRKRPASAGAGDAATVASETVAAGSDAAGDAGAPDGVVLDAPANTFSGAPDDAQAVPAPAPRAARVAQDDDPIGQSGLRLTRDEAMALVREAVVAATTGDEAVSDSVIRERAFAILGRDSESLSRRNFARILRDAHDADIVDLRRRGDGFEVARPVEAPPVAAQLTVHEEAAKAAEPGEPAAPPAPRGMGPRGAPVRG